MRVIRFEHEGELRFGRVIGEGRAALYDRAPWEGGLAGGREVPFDPDALSVPVTPSKIVCVGRNYRAHAEELGNEVPSAPLLFLKPPSALLASGRAIEWPEVSERVDFEGEVGVVIGRRLRRVDAAEAEAGVFGLTCANDVTARDLQRADVQFTRGKGFDTFCPVGPHIETEPPPLDALTLETRVGGEVRQRGSSAQMVFPIPELLSYISHIMTLEPGDLVLTGTPEGVGPLTPGRAVEVEIVGVGHLVTPVRRASVS